MAAKNQRDVSLLIKARDESTKVFNGVADALASLINNQDDLGSSAQRTESRLAQLARGILDLDKAYVAIDGAADRAASAFTRQEAALASNRTELAAVKAQADAAAVALARMAPIADKAFIGPRAEGFLTTFRAVSAEVDRLEAQSRRLTSAIASQESALQGSRSSLQQIGSTTIAVAEAQDRLRAKVELETAALREQAAAAEQVSEVQRRINAITGVSRPNAAGSAAASAEILAEAAARDVLFQKLQREEAERAILARAQEAEIANRRLLNIRDTPTVSARDSAAVFQAADATAIKAFEDANRLATAQAREAAGAIDAEDAAIKRLRADLDPLAVLTQRQAVEMAKLSDWFARGKITAQEFAAAEKLLADNATRAAAALRGGGAAGGPGKLSLFGLKPYELQNLGYQVNDVVTQLASGTSLSQTLAQQGGQILQLFPRVGASVIAVFSNPFFLGAAATIGAFALGVNEAFKQLERLRTISAQLAANADGGLYNPQKINSTVEALDRYGLSAEEALAITRTFFTEGVRLEQFEEFGRAAKDLADVMGIDLKDAAKQVAEAFTSGFEAIDKLDRSTNFLTATQREHIRTMFEEGRAGDARAAAFKIFSDQQEDAAQKSRGPWADAARSLANAWQALIAFIADSLPVQATVRVLKELAGVVKAVADGISGFLGGRTGVAALAGEVDTLRKGIGALKAEIANLEKVNPTSFMLAARKNALAIANRQLAEAEAKLKAARTAPGAGGDPAEQETERQLKADQKLAESEKQRLATEKLITHEQRIQAAIATARRTAADAGASPAGIERAAESAAARERRAIEKEITEEKKRQAAAAKEAAKFAQFQDPVNGPVRSGFGPRSSPGGVGSTFHKGIDFAVPTGTRVNAPAVGVVEAVGFSKELGKYVVIDHGSGTKSKFGHLSVNDIVTAGQLVQAGQEIAKSGNTGTATTGPHLHYTITVNGRPVDPRQNGGKFEVSAGDAVKNLDAVAEKRSEEQQQFNDLVDAENLKRQETIAAATTLQGLTGAARIDAQKQQVVDAAVAAQRAKALKDQLDYTAEQEAVTRALAAAEFEATRGVKERAAAAREAVDQPVADLTAQRNAIQEQIRFFNEQGQTGLADGLGPQLDDVNARLLVAIANARALYAALSGDDEYAVQTRAALGLTREQVDNITLGLDGAKAATVDLGYFMGVSLLDAAQKVASGTASAFDQFAQAIAAGRNAIASLKNAFLSFAADFLRQIAQMIIQQRVFNLVSGLLNTVGSMGAGAAFGAPVTSAGTSSIYGKGLGGIYHQGGIVGSPSNATQVMANWFNNAPRYHRGGIAGLRPDEVPSILQRGEEVLTRQDPRHRSNGGGGAPVQVKNLNFFDAGEMVSEGLNTRVGEQAILNVISRNPRAIKQTLG